MPLTYSIFSNARLLLMRGEGAITQPERVSAICACMEDPGYAGCEDALCDFSATTSTPTMAELREIIALMPRSGRETGPRKLAVIAPKPITFGVAREFRAFVEQAAVPIEVRVFADADVAWSWLRPDRSPGDRER
jgi:hypothetical protein